MKEDSKEWRKEGGKEKERRGRREGEGGREGQRDWVCPQICLTKNGKTFPTHIGLDDMRNTETDGGQRRQQNRNA